MHFLVRRNGTSGEWPVSDTFSSKSNLDIGELSKTTYTDVEHATDLNILYIATDLKHFIHNNIFAVI